MECDGCCYRCGDVNYKESTYTKTDADPTEDAVDQTADIQRQMERQECYALLWQLYDGLSEEDQYMLSQLAQGVRQQDIADALGIPRTTMISRSKKCIAKMQKNLKSFR